MTQLAKEVIEEIVEGEGLKYLAGYAAHRFKKECPSLGSPTRQLPSTATQDLDWIQCISDGHLMYPSDAMVGLTSILNSTFKEFHGEFLSKDDRIFDKVTDLVLQKYENFSTEPIERKVVLCLVRTRTYIRLRQLNKNLTSDPFTKNAKKKIFKFMK
ncbi:hypothetical protein QAD02_003873 [Eretmocerus hayati]|uniref:Uncharacterized protein n=1 Tax=Eretmocerus hayati TaxID=131215 RepID=A0ACC2NNE8_9HYME|nr:hypothetical protein QAD02_003873 [Eretmocerus hayati]